LSNGPTHRNVHPVRELDPVWEAMASGVSPLRRTGTGPVRLADWLPVQRPGPVLVQKSSPATAPEPEARQWTWIEGLVLAFYALLVGVGIAWHEPWADEGQAWLMARNSGFWHMLLYEVRYEGSPGLWHAFLWVLARLHVTYMGMHWISGAFAAAGIYVLLRYSPFPLILRILLPFGFWLAYQDAVIARSYVLFAVLAFPVAAILRQATRRNLTGKHLLVLAVLLGLLANLSLHGLVASIGLAIVALILLHRQAKAGAPVRKALPAAILCCFWIFAIATTIPPSDVNFPAGKNIQQSTFKVWAMLGSQTAKAELAEIKLIGNSPRPGELAMHPEPTFQPTGHEKLLRRVGRALAVVTFPIANYRVLALLTVVLVIAQAIVFKPGRGQLGWIGLIPWALMVFAFTRTYLAPRHAGMVWEAMIVSLWLTWPAEDAEHRRAFLLQRLTVIALVLVALLQNQWTTRSVWADIHKPYSGDLAMAHFLKSLPPGKRIAGFGYHSVGPEAWIGRKLYFNQPESYWVWSQKPRVEARAPFAIATHPDVIVYGGWNWSAQNGDISEDWVKPEMEEMNSVPLSDAFRIVAYAEAHGYRETHRFCGEAFMRSGYSEQLCQVALEPVAAAEAATLAGK
jgi:hypothetical protein